ncbi:CU044_2847 family protein [Longispora sp. K20-0274]|uniref:CU044_2847 family protein n=1 Tax=Longispora sp. K20-0274 TaxID=3088255 RepID=UPI003999B8E0
MGDLLRYESDHGTILIEERDGGTLERIGLLDHLYPAKQRLEAALAQVRPAIDAALSMVRGLPKKPDQVEVEVGVTLTAEAGAVVARTTAEGHLVIRATWKLTDDHEAPRPRP